MKDFDVFDDKKLSDIFKDIHDNTTAKRKDIAGVIKELLGMMKTANDAITIAPLIREFYDVGVKNDEQLVKLATIAQRVMALENQAVESDNLLSDEDRRALLQIAQESQSETLISMPFTSES